MLKVIYICFVFDDYYSYHSCIYVLITNCLWLLTSIAGDVQPCHPCMIVFFQSIFVMNYLPTPSTITGALCSRSWCTSDIIFHIFLTYSKCAKAPSMALSKHVNKLHNHRNLSQVSEHEMRCLNSKLGIVFYDSYIKYIFLVISSILRLNVKLTKWAELNLIWVGISLLKNVLNNSS